jgi:hypothetical protein
VRNHVRFNLWLRHSHTCSECAVVDVHCSLADQSYGVLAIHVVVGCSAVVSTLTAVSISYGALRALSVVSCVSSISSSSSKSQASFSSCYLTRFYTISRQQHACTRERSHHLGSHPVIRSFGSNCMGNPFHLARTTTGRRGRENHRFGTTTSRIPSRSQKAEPGEHSHDEWIQVSFEPPL